MSQMTTEATVEATVTSGPATAFAPSPQPSLAGNKDYLLLLCAKAVSRFGDSIDAIAYSWIVYMLTGSKLLMGTLFAVNSIPSIALSLFTGVLVDRWPKKLIVICADYGRGLLVFATGLLLLTGRLEVWHLFAFTLLISTCEAFASPAENSWIPQILPKALLLKGNSLSGSVAQTAELIGLAAAGGVIAWIGSAGALWVDAATFLLSALILGFVGKGHAQAKRGQTDGAESGRMPAGDAAPDHELAGNAESGPFEAGKLAPDGERAVQAKPGPEQTDDPESGRKQANAVGPKRQQTAEFQPGQEQPGTFKAYFDELKEGLLYVKGNLLIFTTIILAALVNFCLAPINVLQTVYVKELLHAGPETLSLLGMCIAVGMILSGLATARWGGKFRKSTLILFSFLLLGASLALMGFPPLLNGIPAIGLAGLFMLLLGISVSLASAPLRSYIMEVTPPHMMGRTSALTSMMCLSAVPLGGALTGLAADHISVPLLYAIGGLTIILLTLSLLRYKAFRQV